MTGQRQNDSTIPACTVIWLAQAKHSGLFIGICTEACLREELAEKNFKGGFMHLVDFYPFCLQRVHFFWLPFDISFTHPSSRKHVYIILTPLNPTFYSKTGVYSGIHYFSYFVKKNIGCGYSLEPPRRGGSNGYPQSMFWEEMKKKKSDFFYQKIFLFWL